MSRFRVAAIGSTHGGGFGHGLETAYVGLEDVEYVAVADDDPQGLTAAAERTGAARQYADYREMLRRERPDVVSIGPRWVDRRVEMTAAAVEAGSHIYCEKPLAGTLADADAMLGACRQGGRRMAVAHQFRGMGPIREARARLLAGHYGPLLRMRARPKDDHRGGGEELIVHGTHLMDLMVHFAGPPRWVTGHIGVGDRDVTRDDRREGTEPLGPLAGDNLTAGFGFDGSVRGFFDSTVGLFRQGRSPYGLLLECEEAMLLVRSPGDVYVYPAGALVPEDPQLAWEKLWVEDWHFYPDHLPRPTNDWIHRGNQVLVRDLLAAIGEEREPLSTAIDARWALEMIQGVYASHLRDGAWQTLPLVERGHPLS